MARPENLKAFYQQNWTINDVKQRERWIANQKDSEDHCFQLQYQTTPNISNFEDLNRQKNYMQTSALLSGVQTTAFLRGRLLNYVNEMSVVKKWTNRWKQANAGNI